MIVDDVRIFVLFFSIHGWVTWLDRVACSF